MKLIFLGSGSAFTVGSDNFQSNMLLENESGQRLLIDCGSDARWAFHDRGLTHKDVEGVFISHLHADHTGGLEWLAFTTYFDPTCKKPTIYIAKSLVNELWDTVLRGGLSSLQTKQAELSTYFNVVEIDESNAFTWSNIPISLIKTVHVSSDEYLMPSYGLMIPIKSKNILITTDIQFIPDQMDEYYKKAATIFQDCETTDVPSSVHAHYNELKTLDSSIKKKMWLYHYNPGPLPDCTKDGFLGFVKKGQVFEF